MRRTTKAFYDAGGTLTLGTDNPSTGEFIAGFSAHRELHTFVLAGIPPAAALKIATINGARALGVSDKLGTIEVGKLADLFVINGNPLADIKNTRQRAARDEVRDWSTIRKRCWRKRKEDRDVAEARAIALNGRSPPRAIGMSASVASHRVGVRPAVGQPDREHAPAAGIFSQGDVAAEQPCEAAADRQA